MEQIEAWSSHPNVNQQNITRTSTGSRRILTRLIIVIVLIVFVLVGWQLASRAEGHFAATGSVLSANPAAGTFSLQPATPAAPYPGGARLPHLTSNGATAVIIFHSTVFHICRDNPAPAEATSRGCSSASFASVKVGEQVNVVGAFSNNTVAATRVQVLWGAKPVGAENPVRPAQATIRIRR